MEVQNYFKTAFLWACFFNNGKYNERWTIVLLCRGVLSCLPHRERNNHCDHDGGRTRCSLDN